MNDDQVPGHLKVDARGVVLRGKQQDPRLARLAEGAQATHGMREVVAHAQRLHASALETGDNVVDVREPLGEDEDSLLAPLRQSSEHDLKKGAHL